MTVAELIEQLSRHEGDTKVEIATCPRSDEWYEVDGVEPTTNVFGDRVVVMARRSSGSSCTAASTSSSGSTGSHHAIMSSCPIRAPLSRC